MNTTIENLKRPANTMLDSIARNNKQIKKLMAENRRLRNEIEAIKRSDIEGKQAAKEIRTRQIITRLAAGETTSAIAKSLHMTTQTVTSNAWCWMYDKQPNLTKGTWDGGQKPDNYGLGKWLRDHRTEYGV
jgi:hypothetical protein